MMIIKKIIEFFFDKLVKFLIFKQSKKIRELYPAVDSLIIFLPAIVGPAIKG
jgi:hypothetical protein